MTSSLFIALLGYAFVASITPGPNNFMLLSSGTNHGWVRTVPHMVGIEVGFLALLLAVGFGMGSVMSMFPSLYLVIKILGSAYLLYLAWKIAISRSLSTDNQTSDQPMSLIGAAAFQWVNPKCWMMSVSAMAIYSTPEQPFYSILAICAAFMIVGLPSLAAWTVFGISLRQWLSDPTRLKWFNISMGILLALTLWPMLK